jgi:UDPglucose 6-dehydrogenase/GDP-mannose 6-dehydrogenase
MEVSIIGAGYVGLVTATCLAARGHTVVCADINADTVARINRGQSPIFECGLDELLRSTVGSGKLRATTAIHHAVRDSMLTLICVGTPRAPSGVNLRQTVAAAESVGAALATKSAYHVVAVKSTVLPGTTEGVIKTTLESQAGRRVGDGWGLCMTPEFLREGQAINDFLTPDRVVIGSWDDKAANVLLQLYADSDCPKLVTSLRTAEMIKYVANSFFATVISFANEMANLCASIPGIDARDVWKGVHLDRRLTPLTGEVRQPSGVVEFLWHGLGFGGSCFPKDVTALGELGKQLGASTVVLDAVLTTNAAQPLKVVDLIKKETEIRDRTVAILGLAFKPGTDDLRDSSALPIIKALLDEKALVVAHDPVAILRAQSHSAFADVTLVRDWSSALKDADVCCLVTAWPEYQKISPGDFRRLMRHPIVVDGRGLYDSTELACAGVRWRGIGLTPEEALLP